MIGKAVGTKAMLYESAAGKAEAVTPDISIGDTFEVGTRSMDCIVVYNPWVIAAIE